MIQVSFSVDSCSSIIPEIDIILSAAQRNNTDSLLFFLRVSLVKRNLIGLEVGSGAGCKDFQFLWVHG